MFKINFAIIFFLISGFAIADNIDAKKQFNWMAVQAGTSIYICQAQGEAILTNLYLGKGAVDISELNNCVLKSKEKLQIEYKKIKDILAANKEVMALVNDYTVSAIALFDDMSPRSGERNVDRYSARLTAAENELNKKANLIKLQLM